MTAPDLASIRLARAAWDAATPGTRVLLFLRVKYVSRRTDAAFDAAEVPFLAWDYLPEAAQLELAWEFQFLARVMKDARAALAAAAIEQERAAA